MRSRSIMPVAFAASLLASGCSVGPNYKQPQLWSPANWFGVSRHSQEARAHEAGAHEARASKAAKLASIPVSAAPNPSWWDQFGDRELSALESRVAGQNLSVRLATIRFAESRAQLRQAAASEFPSLSGTAAYTREQISSKEIERGLQDGISSGALNSYIGKGQRVDSIRQQAGSLKVPPIDLWQDGIDASWELDLWGRVRRSMEAAKATLQSLAEDRRSTLIAEFAEVARDYMTLRGQQEQLAILRDNLRVAQQSVDLTRARFIGGLTTQLDVENAVAQLDSVAAQIPSAEQQVASQINALSFLLGEPPRALEAELATARPVPPVPPLVPVGVPSELARRRPDIREAEATLHAATANVGVAVAAFYPRVTLSGALNFESLSLRDLGFWASRAYTFGPSISLPIFQGGQLRGALQLNEARQKEAAISYQRTVLQAWQQVDDALTAYRSEQRTRDADERSVQAYERALSLARQQYVSGLQTFLNVLTAERGLFDARGQLASSTTMVSGDLVQLYNALGGGWENAFPRASLLTTVASTAAFR